jgi:hypothetical protein
MTQSTMTQLAPKSLSGAEKEKLPRRDWLMLPVLGLLTIFVILGSAEFAARRMFTESAPFVQSCLEPGASWAGSRAIPNSVCWDKNYESQWVEYQFNGCGFRTPLSCEAEHPGVFRIVLAGSSFAMGHLVQENRTFAALLPEALTEQTGRKIELYNEGMVGVNPHVFTERFNEVLAAKPDLILWALTPWDIENTLPPDSLLGPSKKEGAFARAWFRIKTTFKKKPLPEAISSVSERFWREGQERFADSLIATLLQHFLFQNKNQYVKSTLMEGDSAGYLQTQPSTKWQQRLRQFNIDAAKVEAQATAAHVPFVAVLLPTRVQAAMISMGSWPAGYDPYRLDHELRAIIASHGGIYVDILPDLRTLPNPERNYYPIDGHPNAEGHEMISQLLTKALLSGSVPALRDGVQSKTSPNNGR